MGQGMELLGKRLGAALQNTIQTMTGFCVEQADPASGPGNLGIAGAMVLSGRKNLLLAISVDQKTAQLLISYMTGTDFRDLKQEELQDGITEFANMVAGSAKEALLDTEYEYHLSVPFTIVGEHIRIIAKKKTEKLDLFFNNDEVNILLQMFSF